jgi:RimJ/RimL family protein N-acetyltransferase
MGSTRGPPPAATFRRLATGERGRLLEHFLRLDAEDRHLRFGGHVTDERVRAYCAGLDRSRSVVLGCLVAGELRGVGELKVIAGSLPPAAELAVSVEAPFRGRGIGTELCRRLAVRARNRFVATVHMLCLLDNRRVQRIARGLGGTLAFHPGEAEAEIGLPWPEPLSVTEEWLDETGALLGAGSLARAGPRPWRGAPVPAHPPTTGERP